jgi:hypothetical protein
MSRRLDRATIRALAPGEKATKNGITAERLDGGNTRYTVQIMVDGQRVHKAIGLASEGVTLTQAEVFIEKARTEAREGRLSLPRGRKVALGFAAAADKYLAEMEESGGKNVKAKRRHLKMHLVPFFKDQPIAALSTFGVERYKKQRLAAGAAIATTNRELETLRHAIGVACEKKWLAAPPCKIRRLAGERIRIVALDNGEVGALMAAAVADREPDLWLFIAMALGTSLRHREVLRTRFSEVNFTTLRLHIPISKTGEREQPITRASPTSSSASAPCAMTPMAGSSPPAAAARAPTAPAWQTPFGALLWRRASTRRGSPHTL